MLAIHSPAAACLRALAATSVLLTVWLAAGPAGAHGRSVSYSRWQIDSAELRVRVRLSQLELTRLGITPSSPAQETGQYLADHLRAFASEQPCAPAQPPVGRETDEGWVSFAWTLHCPDLRALRIESRILLDVAPSHLHFARVSRAGGSFVERVLTEAEPSWTLAAEPAATGDAGSAEVGTTLREYVVLGIEHILSGWDHLAFLLALLLLAQSLGEVATLVTAFTVAHSVTLGLAALGVLHPEAAAVEAMIGYSIALVAAENSWLLGGRHRGVPIGVAALALVFAMLALGGAVRASPVGLVGLALFALCHFGLLRRAERPARLRAAIAFAFGLVHGFGFAGVLGEMELARERLLPALFGFNIGVEAGQLAVVALVWPALRALARHDGGRWHERVAWVGSALICGLGVFWFVTRTLG